MSKAEERARAAYPAWKNGIGDEFNSNSAYYGFIEGYHQAKKDLELSWKDVELIYEISCDVFNEQDGCFYEISKIWKEVLKRFKDLKNK